MKRLVFISLSLLLLILVSGCFTLPAPAPNPIPPVGTPSVIMEFSSNPATINSGGTSTLSWNVTGATSVSVDQGIGQVAVAGTMLVSPATSTVYTISATNSAGTVTSSATTTVNSASATAAPINNAAMVALRPDDMRANGWNFDSTIEPYSNDKPISAYSITFKQGQESLTNSVFIYETPGLAEYRHYSGQGSSGQDIHDIGEILAYSVSGPSGPGGEASYGIRFVKSNVYVELGNINNYQELLTYARLMLGRIE